METQHQNTGLKTIFHAANSRGYVDHGWLKSHHTFSFANYYDPGRIHFGALRVINDDDIAGGMGFDMHPHDNMEIITVPLAGSLAHRDSLGSSGVITAGEVQVMSAGTGIRHSEFNASEGENVQLLQIWVFPKIKNVPPRYQQIQLNPENMQNRFGFIVTPAPSENAAWVHQDTWFSLGNFEVEKTEKYTLQKSGNGVYIFIIEGQAEIANQKLQRRDGLGVWNVANFEIKIQPHSKILLMEVPK